MVERAGLSGVRVAGFAFLWVSVVALADYSCFFTVKVLC
jgi:hypothetical protein